MQLISQEYKPNDEYVIITAYFNCVCGALYKLPQVAFSWLDWLHNPVVEL